MLELGKILNPPIRDRLNKYWNNADPQNKIDFINQFYLTLRDSFIRTNPDWVESLIKDMFDSYMFEFWFERFDGDTNPFDDEGFFIEIEEMLPVRLSSDKIPVFLARIPKENNLIKNFFDYLSEHVVGTLPIDLKVIAFYMLTHGAKLIYKKEGNIEYEITSNEVNNKIKKLSSEECLNNLYKLSSFNLNMLIPIKEKKIRSKIAISPLRINEGGHWAYYEYSIALDFTDFAENIPVLYELVDKILYDPSYYAERTNRILNPRSIVGSEFDDKDLEESINKLLEPFEEEVGKYE